MSSNSSGRKHASWRTKKGAAAEQPTLDRIGRRGLHRRRILFQFSALITFTLALFVFLAWWMLNKPDRDVPIIFAAVTQSTIRSESEPLPPPPNPFAFEDAQWFESVFSHKANQNLVFLGNKDSQTGPMERAGERLTNAIVRPLASVTAGGPGGNMIAIFVFAHGHVHDNQPYLLVGDSEPQDPSTWVPVEKLFNGIDEQLKKRRTDDRVVMFVDTSRSGPIWDWGKMDESFAKSCSELAEKIGSDKIAVIASSKDGQRSLCDLRLGRSLFAKAVVRSLIGDGDLNGDGYITVGEIAESIRRHVVTEAQTIWAAEQEPVLLTESAKNWQLIQTPDASEILDSIPISTDQLTDSFDKIDTLWVERDKLKTKVHSPIAVQPLAWSLLEKKLARLDLLALAGSSYNTERNDLFSACRKLIDQLSSPPAGLSGLSNIGEQSLEDYLVGIYETSAFERDLHANWKKDPDPEKIALPPELGKAEITRFLWNWLADQGYTPDALRTSEKLLSRVYKTQNAKPDALETHLIRLLSSSDMQHLDADRIEAILGMHRVSRQAMFPKDIRAAIWLRKFAGELEQKRMFLADAVMSRVVWEEKSNSEKEILNKQFSELANQRQLIAESYATRDQMLHRIPRLMETFFWDFAAFERAETDKPSAELFRQAIDATSCLCSQLQNVTETENAEQLAELAKAHNRSSSIMRNIDEMLESRVSAVGVTQATDERGLRQAFALLQGSGVDNAKQRERIHTRLLELVRQEMNDLEVDIRKIPSVTPQDQTEPKEAYLLSSKFGGKHPWVDWLESMTTFSCRSISTSASASKADSAAESTIQPATSGREQGAVIRQAISVLEPIERQSADAIAAIAKQTDSSPTTIRRGLDQTETALRAKTFLLTHRSTKMVEVFEDRFLLDVQLFLLDHADRTLQEFWCEARPGENPYFADATERLMRLSVYRSMPSFVDGTDLRASLTTIKQTLQREETILVPEPAEDRHRRAYASQIADQKIPFTVVQPAIRELLPAGRVSVWADTTEPQAELMDVGIESGDMRPIFKVPAEVSNELVVRSFYRGLRRDGGLTVRTLGDPQTVLYRTPVYGPPRAIVESDQKAGERIVLVLDCSSSMNKSLGGSSRLDQAREATKKLLRELPNNTEVGLIVFGHRFGWVEEWVLKEGKGQWVLVADPGATRGSYKVKSIRENVEVIMESLTLDSEREHNPNFDVEVKREIAALAGDRRNALVANIDQLRAVGVTPTYQAIVKAYDILRNRPGRIILLTDGRPFLAGNEDESRPEAVRRYRDNKANTKLHIVNFANVALQEGLEKEFPGSVVNAADGNALEQIFLEFTRKEQVVWTQADGPRSTKEEVGQKIALEKWPPSDATELGDGRITSPATYQIELSDPKSPGKSWKTDVNVEGGELFKLRLSADRLIHKRFPRENNVIVELQPVGGNPRNLAVLALAPDKNNNRELTLRLVLETNASGEFTPRPSDIWVDLIGFDAESKRKTEYRISNAEFAVNEGVPIVVCRVADWPEWASNIQIHAWFRFGDPKAPAVAIPVDRNGPFSIDAFPSVQFELKRQGLEIELTETHTTSNADPLRILCYPTPPKSRVEVFEDGELVRHHFTFQQIPNNLRIFATKKSEIETDALHVRGTVKLHD